MNNFEIYKKYLRKSREDEEFEKSNNEYKTLERHNERLKYLESATGKVVLDKDIYEEVVSGDSIEARPVIQQLLKDIENPNVKGVWVIDVQRLCRGDLGDQDRIIKSFKYTNTMILTPEKEYDLSNPIDEELLIDKLSYSRKEYNNIKKRLIEGRKDSIMSGCFIGNAPFGYERMKLKGRKGWTLKIVGNQAEIIKMIFTYFLNDKGTEKIANELNSLNIKSPTGKKWTNNQIRLVLHNETYCGLVKYQKEKKTAFMKNGKISYKTVKQKQYFTTKGLHDPIISLEDFEHTKIKLKDNSQKYVKENVEFKNPLAGILKCKNCGRVMTRHESFYKLKDGTKKLKKPNMHCPNYKNCGTISHYYEDIEEIVLKKVNEWLNEEKKILKDYEKNKDSLKENSINKIEIIDKAIEKEQIKINRIRSFLEDGTYDKETYNIRITPVLKNIETLKNSKNNIIAKDENNKIEKLKILIPKAEKGLSSYDSLSAIEKNELLHSILEKVEYEKIKNENEIKLNLQIYPKI